MQNIKTTVKNGKLLISIDLSAKPKKSASGKSLVIASTRGNSNIGDGIMLGVNCYKSAK